MLLFVLAGCLPSGQPSLQEHGTKRAVQGEEALDVQVFLPPPEQRDSGVLTFKARLQLGRELLERDAGLARELQFRADSLFCLVTGRDTLWPDWVQPVANGQRLRPEYLVSFSRPSFPLAGATRFLLSAGETWTGQPLSVTFDTRHLQRFFLSTN